MRYLVLIAVLAVLVAGFLALGWSDAFFGDGEERGVVATEGGPAETRPTSTTGREGAPETSVARPRTLFGRRREVVPGVGSVALRVVRWGANVPVADAKVSLGGTGHGGEAVVATVASDRHGAAFLPAVAAGEGYVVRVDAPGEASVARAEVDVGAGETTDLGTIYVGVRAVLEGRVVDESGGGVAKAVVRVHADAGSWLDMMSDFAELLSTLDREPKAIARTTTGDDGRFRVEDLAPGALTVVASASGRMDARVEATLGEKGTRSPLVLVVRRGSTVAGKVVNDEGRGVGGARLAILGDGSSDPVDFLYGRVFATTDDSGAFRASVPDDGRRLRAFVAAEGHPTTYSDAFSPDDADVRIVLRGGARVAVLVVAKEDRAPIEGAKVTLAVGGEDDGAGAMVSGATDRNGRVELLCPPGEVEAVMAAHPEFAGGLASSQMDGADESMTAMRSVMLEADFPDRLATDAANRVEVRMRRGLTVHGKVTDGQGAPVAGAEVKAPSMMGFGGSPSTRSGTDGVYRLAGIGADASLLALTVKAPGFVLPAARARVTEKPDARGEIAHDIVLEPATTVRGRVVDPEGKGLAGARVRLVPSDGALALLNLSSAAVPAATTADDGSYAIFDVGGGSGLEAMLAGLGERVPADAPVPAAAAPRLRVRASLEGYAQADSAEFDAAAGATVAAPVVTLDRGASIRGRVLDPAGNPLAHARLQATVDVEGDRIVVVLPGGGDGRQREVTSDAQGAFLVDGLPASTVTLSVSRAGFADGRRKVTVAQKASVDDVEIRLQRAKEVRGRVVGPDGHGIARASVSVSGNVDGSSGESAFLVSERAAADGTFVVRGLPPGRVRLQVSAPGHVEDAREVETGGPSIDIALAARSASAAARLAEIDAEMRGLATRLLEAKSDAERTGVQQRFTALQEEKQQLEKQGR